MRRRYLTASRRVEAQDDPDKEWWEKDTNSLDLFDKLVVHEPETRSRNSGILDAHGNPIIVIEEPEPIGFVPQK